MTFAEFEDNFVEGILQDVAAELEFFRKIRKPPIGKRMLGFPQTANPKMPEVRLEKFPDIRGTAEFRQSGLAPLIRRDQYEGPLKQSEEGGIAVICELNTA
ncbi:hypothetical protein [Pseudosulfitobacter sp. SM2401]|uniref:hypothetical protein n=1 Tax=Pseudosulfitobacter sp. SM2401 TaxID=3350098 RepID=UPI0036F2AE20